MKTNSNSFIRLCLLLLVTGMPIMLQAQRLTFREADSLVVARSHDLKSARLDVTAAEGQQAQSKRYDNPTVSMMYNVRNPNNRRWFDAGRDGEVDVQISQPFAIGGQHAEQVRQNDALLQASRSQLQVTERNLRIQVHTLLIDLYYQQRQAEAYDVEIASAEKILSAYREQSAKGNIAEMETQRIATMIYQLSKSRADLLLAAADLQSQLRLLLGIDGSAPIVADLNEQEALAEASHLYLELQGGEATATDTLPELCLLNHQTEAARHALKWQRSQGLPQLAVQGEYDKNGSIGHNFYAVGLSVSLPLWNHNRGNIRSAKAALEQAAIAADRQRLALQQQRQADVATLGQYLRQLGQSSSLDTDMASMLQAAEQQFLNRHITLMEFVDLYANYRDTMLARLDAKDKLLQAAERLKVMWGSAQDAIKGK
jgi:cobalt-zinc-cadmium efflux system outer membrane protein